MKFSDIVVGGKYSNATSKSAGVRIVDSIFERVNGERALAWTSAVPRRLRAGHDRGVSTVATFARWAQASQAMTTEETTAYEQRATQWAQIQQQYGTAVRALITRQDQ
ncbi:hypothetical protein [Variovorax gossypii]